MESRSVIEIGRFASLPLRKTNVIAVEIAEADDVKKNETQGRPRIEIMSSGVKIDGTETLAGKVAMRSETMKLRAKMGGVQNEETAKKMPTM
mmetsp:Transcript_18184/g.25297  ORF Transcript_18184/g.25297 Transcript_18184/m.25297 type:complete len:92 (+) Transcript_18184:36-311(+)